MIAQVTAAALVSENKIYCHPASVDSIPSSAGREDHVSMGAHAALKFAHVQDQVRTVLAIELMAGAQGIDLRRPHKPGRKLRAVHELIREHVSFLDKDRVLSQDFQKIRSLIDDGSIVKAAEKEQA
jgi:histidine ammonia-lyase